MKGGEFFALVFNINRAARPVGGFGAHRLGHMRHQRNNRPQIIDAAIEHAQHLGEYRHQHIDLTDATARQYGERDIGFLQTIFRGDIGQRLQRLQPVGNRVTDKMARRPVIGSKDIRLERQKRHHRIKIAAHFARPPAPPGPHMRCDIANDFGLRAFGFHPLGDAVIELRAINQHHHIRLAHQRVLHGLIDAFE